MSQELTAAPAVINGAIILPELVSELSNVQRGWLMMAEKREQTVHALTKYELEVQQLVKDAMQSKDPKTVAELLKTAKARAEEGKDCRLQFTRIIDEKLIKKLMEYEGRNTAAIAPLISHELEVRKEAVRQAGQVAQKNEEAAQLKAHVENEHARRAHQYRKDLNGMVVDAYKTALSQAVAPAALPEFLKTVRGFITEHKPVAFQVFQRRFVGDEEAKQIFASVPAPDLKSAVTEALVALQKQFEMYEQDLQNAQAAIKQADAEKEIKDKQEDEALQTDIHTNTLIAKAAIVTGLDAPKVKRSYGAVDVGTEEWAFAVCGTFMAHWAALKPYVKVKVLSKLSIGQMAEALAKLKTAQNSIVFDARIQFSEIEK